MASVTGTVEVPSSINDSTNGNELMRLKSSFNDVTTTFNLKGKNLDQLKSSAYKKETLAEALITVIDICQNTINLLDKENNPQDFVEQIANKVQNALAKMVPELVANVLKKDENTAPKESIQDREKHVIILEDKNDSENKYDESTWSQVVKSNISKKLKNVPVQKSVVTKSGQGCIFFPTKDDQAQAHSILQDEFKVSSSTNKVKLLLPKLKVFKIDESYKKEDKEILKADILEKNPYISALSSDTNVFEVIIIDEKQHFCILKVSPIIREAIMKRGSIFINMESHTVKDNIHVIQCFCCQEHGHKKGDNECKHKNDGKNTCLYCSGDHESRNCRFKKDCSQWNCSNCANSKNPQYKMNSKGHTTTSSQCPFVIQQSKAIISRTQGLELKNFSL